MQRLSKPLLLKGMEILQWSQLNKCKVLIKKMANRPKSNEKQYQLNK